MRPEQRNRHAERIERVIRALNRRDPADPGPTLAEIAELAGVSRYHFHRLYRVMTGETVHDTLRRLRLARALPALKDGRRSITEAAMDAGYASSQAFARALKAHTGITASAARRCVDTMAALESVLSRPAGNATVPATALEVEIVAVEPVWAIARRNVGDYAELFDTYESLFSEVLERTSMDNIQGILGIHVDDPRSVPPAEVRFDCALRLSDDIEPGPASRWIQLPGGSCARTRHTGNYASLLDTADALYAAVVRDNLQPRDAPLFAHYLDDPGEVPASQLRTDLYIPLCDR